MWWENVKVPSTPRTTTLQSIDSSSRPITPTKVSETRSLASLAAKVSLVPHSVKTHAPLSEYEQQPQLRAQIPHFAPPPPESYRIARVARRLPSNKQRDFVQLWSLATDRSATQPAIASRKASRQRDPSFSLSRIHTTHTPRSPSSSFVLCTPTSTIASSVASAMVDDESISVKITASKEVETALGMPATSASGAAKGDKFTMYTVFVRNVTTDGKTVVRRRYSDFYKLRKELVEIVSWNHCGFCDQYLHQISQYPFPRRRLLRSSRAAVVKERMDSLRLFLRHMLLCLMHRSFDDCSQAREKIEECILKSFLQIDNASSLFPNLSTKQQRPIEILQAKEEKRHQEQIKAAGLRTQSYGYTSQIEREMGNPQVPQPHRQVATDTCHICLQKWTHCYCNEEQDSIYPVNMNPAHIAQREIIERALSGHSPYQEPSQQQYQQQPQQYQPHHHHHHQIYNGATVEYPSMADQQEPPYQHRESYSSMDSDASRCSRCARDWDNCYCCQQVSPTASSVCTDR